MFGSDNFPLGPAGGYPKQRIRSFNNPLIPGVSMQDTYLSGGSTVSKLPNLERDFNASNQKVKGRLKQGSQIRGGGGYRGVNRFRPRYAPFFGSRRIPKGMSGYEDDFEQMMDVDPIYELEQAGDEGEVDDSVGFYRGRDFRGRMSPFAGLLKRGVIRRR